MNRSLELDCFISFYIKSFNTLPSIKAPKTLGGHFSYSRNTSWSFFLCTFQVYDSLKFDLIVIVWKLWSKNSLIAVGFILKFVIFCAEALIIGLIGFMQCYGFQPWSCRRHLFVFGSSWFHHYLGANWLNF